MSDELKLKLSLAKKGKVFTDEHRANLSKSHLGKIPSNIEMFKKCRKGISLSGEHKDKIGKAHKGKAISIETREKLSKAGKGKPAWTKGLKGLMAGEKNANWISDRSKIKVYDRQYGTLHTEWARTCKDRDSRRCKLGNKECKGQLEVHHIYRFSEYPNLRYETSNGITLCHFHHPRKKALEEELKNTFIKLIS